MKTLETCLNMFKTSGYTVRFKATDQGLKSLVTKNLYNPNEVKIVNFIKIDDTYDPFDIKTLYAIETYNGEKGLLQDSYGQDTDANVGIFVYKALSINKNSNNNPLSIL